MAVLVNLQTRRRSRVGNRDYDADYLVANLLWFFAASGVPEPVREHRFHPTRRWRFDLAWPDRRIAVEVDGGTWMPDTDEDGKPTRGAHSRGAGQRRDFEKQNEAAILGWRVLRVSTDMVRDGTALEQIARALTETK